VTYYKRAYEKEVENWARQSGDLQRIRVHETWFHSDTADFWRHWRMYGAVDPLAGKSDATWLTVGDGRYGLDSIRLRQKGINAVPSDIAEQYLRKAKQDGLIDQYYVENVESLTFGDDSFDYVFCKETFHHLPRPMIALYEMVRVAREAVVLIEPNDDELPLPGRVVSLIISFSISLPRGLVSRAIRVLHGVWPKKNHVHTTSTGDLQEVGHCIVGPYEPGGNYVYSLSKKEVVKAALGLNLPAIAHKGLNDYYIKGCEFEKATFKSSKYQRIRVSIFRADMLSKLRLRNQDLLMIIIFKKPICKDTIERLRSGRWNIIQLPRNPYP